MNKLPSAMTFILLLVKSTPLWVWFIFGYLLYVGIQATKKHIVFLPKLCIIPLILTGMKYKFFMFGGSSIWLYYGVALTFGITIGYLYAKYESITILKEAFSIQKEGSYLTLVILILFFIIKYIFGYVHATNPAVYIWYINLEIATGGLFSGYFLGKALCYINQYRRSI